MCAQRILSPTADHLQRAAQALRAGDLVAFPTETVFGLGADARNPQAVARIFAAKGRPADHPLIVHLHEGAALNDWAIDVPVTARLLAGRFWPGPLTLILKRASSVPDAVTGGQDTVGLRCPAHPVAQALLGLFGGGIAAPSANRYGRISPTRALHVAQEIAPQDLAIILDGPVPEVGIESTIIDLSGEQPRILRPGGVSARDLAAVLECAPEDLLLATDKAQPRVSGSLLAHYAPVTPMRLLASDQLAFELDAARQSGRRVGLLAFDVLPGAAMALPMPANATAYAQTLYDSLRQLDSAGLDEILVEAPPKTPEWLAVYDRLNRACYGSGA